MNIRTFCSKIFYFTIFFFAIALNISLEATAPWSKVYHRPIKPRDFTSMDHKKIFALIKLDVMPFSQLIFSWNADRPAKGHFSFFVQVRDKSSKKWGSWHQMMDWGAQTQKSYMSKSDGMSSFHHVRLEMDEGKLADAFKVKIVAKDDAALTDIKAVSVTLSNFNCFSPEDCETTARFLPSVYVKSVPKYSQMASEHPDKNRICSPTSCAMLINYIKKGKSSDTKKIAKKVFDTGLDAYGNWPFNTAHAFECCNGQLWFYPRRLDSFIDIQRQLEKGLPVIVSVRGNLPKAPMQYTHGHLLVVVGWNAKTKEVIVHDPAFETQEKTLQAYPLASFIKAWEKSHRLAYWVDPVKVKRNN